MERYNLSVLKELLGEEVTITDDGGQQAQLRIKEVAPGKINGDEWEAFSVIYTGNEELRVPQGTFTFAHPAFGEVALFVSPNSETEYETVVTRKIETSK